jgi:hypothetical protein
MGHQGLLSGMAMAHASQLSGAAEEAFSKKCSQNVRTLPQNEFKTWSRLGDSNWRTYALRVRLDYEENQELAPLRVVHRHLWCHPDVPRRIENVRKMFALFKT